MSRSPMIDSRSVRPRLLPATLLWVALLLPGCTGGAGAIVPGSTAPPSPAARISGWLHTENGVIRDMSGHPIRFLSVNVTGMGAGNGAPKAPGVKGWFAPTPATYANIERWGFNSIRLTISWANLEPQPPTVNADGSVIHHYNEPWLGVLDEEIRQWGRHHVAVILCLSQFKWSPAFAITRPDGVSSVGSGMPAWLYPDAANQTIYQAKHDFFNNVGGQIDGFAEAWRFIASRYANQPVVVGADLMNEPYHATKWLPTPESVHLDSFYRTVGGAVHGANPRVLLIVEDTQDKGDGNFGLSGPPTFPNLVYSFHAYTDTWAASRERTDHYLARARAWHVPVWVGEFNRFGSVIPGKTQVGDDWPQQLSEAVTYWRQHGIGWAYYAYHGPESLGTTTDKVRDPVLLGVLQRGF